MVAREIEAETKMIYNDASIIYNPPAIPSRVSAQTAGRRDDVPPSWFIQAFHE